MVPSMWKVCADGRGRGGRSNYQNGGLLLVFLSNNKTISLVIAHGNLTRRHLVGKIYTKF
jgi:hypothetical protein